MENNIPYQLIAKYLSGESTTAEKDTLESWISEKRENKEIMEKMEAQWKEAQIDASSFVYPNKSLVWERIQSAIQEKAGRIPMYPRNVLIKVAGFAAAITFAICLTFYFLLNKSDMDGNLVSNIENTIISPPGQKTQVILSDGTKVWLNSGSQLSYDGRFNSKERAVKLKGEAYFDVMHNEKAPFVVKTEAVNIKVLGTAFDVNAYDEEKDVKITLERGKVQVLSSAHENVLATLLPNQSATISRKNLLCRISECDALAESSWHLNMLVFEGASAAEVWKKLSRWYGVNISITGNSMNNRYWFKVKTESLTELLNMINIITPIEYKLDGKEVAVRYK